VTIQCLLGPSIIYIKQWQWNRLWIFKFETLFDHFL